MANYGGWYRDAEEIEAWAAEAPEQLVRVEVTTKQEDSRVSDSEYEFHATRRNAAKALLVLYGKTWHQRQTRWDWHAVLNSDWTLYTYANEVLAHDIEYDPEVAALFEGEWRAEHELLTGLLTGKRPEPDA